MIAMILAAGRGKRMRPLTDTLPKPLLEVKNKPLIIYIIEKLVRNGFKTIVINIAHLGYKIPQALGNGKRWGIDIIYSDEQEEGALESAGGIIKALPHLGEKFLVVNGDVWCDYEFDNNFDLKDKLAHLILVQNPDHNQDGDFYFNDEKYTFSGIGYYSSEIFKSLTYGSKPLAPILRKNIELNNISFELYNGIWRDIGTPQRLKEINDI